jgi:hypothetical protein
LLEEGYVFEGPCSVVVSVNGLYDVVIEVQEEGEPLHELMGVYERMAEGKEVNGRGVLAGALPALAGRAWSHHVRHTHSQCP